MDRRIERTRRTVVRSTVELVAREGSHVGMTEIAQAAGVSRKAVYENFGTREQVLLSATQSLLRAQGSTRSAAESAPVGLHDALREVVEHIGSRREYYAAVLAGPASHQVREALADHALAHVPAPSASVAGPVSRMHERFVIHGVLGVVAEALQADPDAAITDLVDVLTEDQGGAQVSDPHPQDGSTTR